jgi:hypothetical protein
MTGFGLFHPRSSKLPDFLTTEIRKSVCENCDDPDAAGNQAAARAAPSIREIDLSDRSSMNSELLKLPR